jgi:outer membrane immunogenic protein
MRWALGTLLALGLTTSSALAGDLAFLPGTATVGPATFTRWSGFYAGGQIGYGESKNDFSGATAPLVSYSLRNTTLENQQSPSQYQVLGTANTNAAGFGGFVGYNTQWQDLILGLEGNYTRTNLNASASTTPISRTVSAGGAAYSVNLTGTGTVDLTDYASIRARAGWIVGNMLPYAFIGLAVGHGSYSVTSLVYGQQGTQTPTPIVPCVDNGTTCVDYSYANSNGQNSAFLYGAAVGGGLDVAVTQNIFLRGEFEYVQFAPISNIAISIFDARIGGGFKF